MRSDALGNTLLPKRIALPVFASDALSSVAYAPDEILLTLSFAGLGVTALSPAVGLAVVVLLVVVVASYRQTVKAYPSGGGDYEVATKNLGGTAGLVVASALLVDYVLTVAVSISSGAQYLSATFPVLAGSEALIGSLIIAVLALLNLRGMRESGKAFAIPTYLYLVAIGAMICTGIFQWATGSIGHAPTAMYEIAPKAQYSAGLVGIGGAILMLRAFSSGCAALTGVEAIANGVPAFKKPKSKNAATTLALLGTISAAMLMSILLLAGKTGVRSVENPATDLLVNGKPVGTGISVDPVIGQLAATIFANAKPMFYLVTIVTGLILVLAANTAFNGFPQLAQVLARDSFLPRQLYNRGDRLSYSNGILVLATGAIVLVLSFDAQVTRLIQLYIVGVFIAFTTSQLGMVVHWSRELSVSTDADARTAMKRSRVVNVIGFLISGAVLIIVMATKFIHGAWMALLLMALVFAIMMGIRKHYRTANEELEVPDYQGALALPSRVHAVVLVSNLHQPAMRAISYARATSPSTLELLTVDIDPDSTRGLKEQWKASAVPVPLTVLASPFRDITGPVAQYVRNLRKSSPRDLVVVYIPEYLVAHWWESALHNHSATRLRVRLQFVPGVVMATVPWQLTGAYDHVAKPGANSTINPPEQSRKEA